MNAFQSFLLQQIVILLKIWAYDAVLPSKLTNILAVGGNAVITAENTTLGFLCNEFKGIATLVNPESVSIFVRVMNFLSLGNIITLHKNIHEII